jgi:hypothetical protein
MSPHSQPDMGSDDRAFHLEQKEYLASYIAEGLEAALTFGDDEVGLRKPFTECRITLLEYRARSWLRSGMISTILPSSSVTTRPQSASQMRQSV